MLLGTVQVLNIFFFFFEKFTIFLLIALFKKAFLSFLCYTKSMKNKLLFLFLLLFSLKAYPQPTPYEILGVSPSVTDSELKEAYRNLAKRWHPDVQGGSEEKFKEIKGAYDTIVHSRENEVRETERTRTYGPSTNEYSSGVDLDRTFKDIFNETQQQNLSQSSPLKPYEIKAIETFKEFSFFQKEVSQFLEGEARYLSLLQEQQKGSSLSRSQQRDLNDYRVQNLKDLEVFKRVLSHMGLPYEVLHPILLQTYLDDLKREWYNNNKSDRSLLSNLVQNSGNNLIERGERPLAEERFVKEVIRRVLHKLKNQFDILQYESLREGSYPFKRSFLKNFGTQFIVFHAALGFSIYMQALYDQKITGYEKNPEELMAVAQQSLEPAGILSFFVFVTMASQVQYRMYGLGRFMDGKTVLGNSWNGRFARALAPSLGLGAGYLSYSLFYGLLTDPHLLPCAKQMFTNNEESQTLKEHINPCEQFYRDWQAGEKWKHYAVDIVSIIGASLISHKITSSIAKHLSRTMIGHRAMAWFVRKFGIKLIRGGNFFLNMFLFLEVHKYLDQWAGKPLKEQILAAGVDRHVSYDFVDSLDYIASEFWTESPEGVSQEVSQAETGLFQRLTERRDYASSSIFRGAINSLQLLGHRFRLWTEYVNQEHLSSHYYWMQKINKRFINYETSLSVLDRLFVLSQIDYNTYPEESLSQYNEPMQEFIRTNNFSSSFNYQVFIEDQEHYKETYCSRLEDTQFSFWKNFCEDESIDFSEETIIYETSQIIYDFFQNFQFPDYGLKAEDYISLNRDELFSSDPRFSVRRFLTRYNGIDYDKRLGLAKKLIKRGLDVTSLFDNLSSRDQKNLREQKAKELFSLDPEAYRYFMSPYSYINEINEYCSYFEIQEDLEYCLEYFKTSGQEEIRGELSLKFLTAGLYLLQEFIKESPAWINQAIVSGPVFFEPIEDLIFLIETHKKGEKAFLDFIAYRESAKSVYSQIGDHVPGIDRLRSQDGNPYVVFYNLICQSTFEISPDTFSVPQLLEDFNRIELYDFTKEEYESLSSVCSKAPHNEDITHEFLFDRPARYESQNYENLYIAVETVVGSHYQNREELMSAYYDLSLEQLELFSRTNLPEIKLLIDEFYSQALNKEIEISYNEEGINQELLDYYDRNKVSFSYCDLFTDLTYGFSQKVFGECEEGFKNIELAIFQVNHLLKSFNAIMKKGDEIKACEDCQNLNKEFLGLEESWNEEIFKGVHSQVITELQKTHDCFKENREACAFDYNLTEQFMVYIVWNSAPKLLGNHFFMKYNLELTESHWEKLVYSLLFELRKSLDNFTHSVMPLSLKSHFEEKLQDPSMPESSEQSL